MGTLALWACPLRAAGSQAGRQAVRLAPRGVASRKQETQERVWPAEKRTHRKNRKSRTNRKNMKHRSSERWCVGAFAWAPSPCGRAPLALQAGRQASNEAGTEGCGQQKIRKARHHKKHETQETG